MFIMTKYLTITALYRFICGGLILIINWELANPESTSDLALATILSFVPAIFTPFLIRLFFKNYSGAGLTKLRSEERRVGKECKDRGKADEGDRRSGERRE